MSTVTVHKKFYPLQTFKLISNVRCQLKYERIQNVSNLLWYRRKIYKQIIIVIKIIVLRKPFSLLS